MVNQKGFIKFMMIMIIILTGIIWVFLMLNKQIVNRPRALICTQEAKQCPDGSYVGRTGPKCEFAACPTPMPNSEKNN